MIIFPAIDLLGGQAVRLYQGDYDKVTVYDSDPLMLAQDFRRKGAQWLHLVDLDAARSGEVVNAELIKLIADESGLNVQAGGGIRSVKVAGDYLDCGVDRVILGTAAAEDRELLVGVVNIFSDQAAVSVDVRDGLVMTHGWAASTGLHMEAYLKDLDALGVRTLIVTDISRDGVQQGPNLKLYEDIMAAYRFDLIAAGGVSTVADIKALRGLNLYGAIVGRALYTGGIKLEEALAAAK
ncbi:MAG: 1-(5-phosphoribosyl)-5-[(5-phosphoribosylamino)methylideneamino]imidazole-4-carboxamide isomerase [Christensenellales bacterium]